MKKEQYFKKMDMMKQSFIKCNAKEVLYPYYVGRIEGMVYMAIEDGEIVNEYLAIVDHADDVKREMKGAYYESKSI